MTFLNEKEARQCWEEMRLFHGADIDDEDAYNDWLNNNGVEWLDKELHDLIDSSWKGVF